jgi:CDP-paratose 2-epimerase
MRARGDGRDTVLITGGAGFVGCNVAAALAADGLRVRLLDDLSRPGVERNLRWLQSRFGPAVELVRLDLAEDVGLEQAVRDVAAVFHFAAQVAVTTSLAAPALDFRTNLLGTFRLLEAVRGQSSPPPVIFASTNKVYGDLGSLTLVEDARRYLSPQRPAIDESQPLRFHTPYGCSKGGAEQYVLDYARTFGIAATALRMSCVYGPHQCGTEDQGWVAHFLLQARHGRPITIYGDGKQVRDILFVEDLVAAQRAALEHVGRLSGQPWNVGGGLANSVSLLEVLELIGEVTGAPPVVEFRPPRPGDQQYYVSDHGAFSDATGWRPRVGPAEGVQRLERWFAAEAASTAAIADARGRAVGGR